MRCIVCVSAAPTPWWLAAKVLLLPGATLQVKTPDGQTVVVAQANTPSPPELTRRWFLRQSEPSDEPYLSMVTMSEPDIPVVWP